MHSNEQAAHAQVWCNKTNSWIDFVPKKNTRKSGKRIFSGVTLAPIGSKKWIAEFNKAIKHPGFNLTISKEIYDVRAKEHIAEYFGAELKPNGIEKAQLHIINLIKDGKL